jgi:hypothetical protein
VHLGGFEALREGEIAPENGGAYISERLIHLQRVSPGFERTSARDAATRS